MSTNLASSSKRSAWPYAIAGYFFVAFCAAAVFVTWAVRQNMDLVRSDYYEHEILFQKQIDAVNRTRPWMGQIAVAYKLDRHQVTIRLPSAHVGSEFRGTAHLYRPSDARLDQRIDLKPNRDGTQSIDTTALAPGLWKVHLDWTVSGEAFAHEQSIVIGG